MTIAAAVLRAAPFMRAHDLDGWLVYDFRGSNPVMRQLLPGWVNTTRRGFLFLPATGEAPRLLVHAIEASHFRELSEITVLTYAARGELLQRLRELLAGASRIAMEYSPDGELPTVSWVDGGTLEMTRACGVEVATSADLFQVALTNWSEAALASHLRACTDVVAVKDCAFDYIARALGTGETPTEFEVQEEIGNQFRTRELDTDHPAIVAVNDHSGDPHYAPPAESSSPIRPGDWVLIDLWARCPGQENVFADITWVACAGEPTPEQRRVFDIVREARDVVLCELEMAFRQGRTPRGWELDRAARDFVIAEGFGEFFPHRTGHSLGPGPSIHGLGVNLDDLETRDWRSVLPGAGFTIEPGIYLPAFGVRLEVNVYIDPAVGPRVTTPLQNEIARLL